MHLVEVATRDELTSTLEELRTAEEELRAQNEALAAAQAGILSERQRYQELFNFAPHGYLVTDAEGVIDEANLAAAELLGRQRRFLSGKPLRVFVVPEDQDRFDRLLARARDGGPMASDELRLVRGDQPPVPVAVHINASDLPPDGSVHLRWLFHDLSALKAAQERIARADRLAAIGQTVAAIGHDSRTILQRAQACLRLLRLEIGKQSAALSLVDRAGGALDDLARLFDDIRAVVATPRLSHRHCDLRDVWRGAWDQALPAGRPAARLEEVSGDPTCTADPFRLGQVFANLFDNALAVGAERVMVAVADADLDGRPAICVSVRDDGPGLTQDQRARVFEPFFTTRPDGTGLGMAVVQGIVEAHGG
ncbi:MAG TPA: ATP-binding protein, partial [Gemmataceae bacterium]|nr:ATP-binding protein [Gemmataceae bacterium]